MLSKQFPSWAINHPHPRLPLNLCLFCSSGGIFWLLSVIHHDLSFQADFSWKPSLAPGIGFHVSFLSKLPLKTLSRVRGDQHFLTPWNVCLGPVGLVFKFKFRLSRSGAEPGALSDQLLGAGAVNSESHVLRGAVAVTSQSKLYRRGKPGKRREN